MNFHGRHDWRVMATMLLWLGLGMCQMACLLPQDDDILTPVPVPANRPLLILQELPQPPQRETTVRLAANCGSSRSTFSVRVEDPDVNDAIQARWLIDPDENYLGGVPGNPGTPVQGSPTKRQVSAPVAFTTVLGGLVDGRKHRVEVVVTDSQFVEIQRENGGTSYLGVTRDPFPDPSVDGGIKVAAYRDEWVWLVEVLPCP